MTVVHVYAVGFVATMGLCTWAYHPIIDRKNMVGWTITMVVVSALWPLLLIALLVAASDR